MVYELCSTCMEASVRVARTLDTPLDSGVTGLPGLCECFRHALIKTHLFINISLPIGHGRAPLGAVFSTPNFEAWTTPAHLEALSEDFRKLLTSVITLGRELVSLFGRSRSMNLLMALENLDWMLRFQEVLRDSENGFLGLREWDSLRLGGLRRLSMALFQVNGASAELLGEGMRTWLELNHAFREHPVYFPISFQNLHETQENINKEATHHLNYLETLGQKQKDRIPHPQLPSTSEVWQEISTNISSIAKEIILQATKVARFKYMTMKATQDSRNIVFVNNSSRISGEEEATLKRRKIIEKDIVTFLDTFHVELTRSIREKLQIWTDEERNPGDAVARPVVDEIARSAISVLESQNPLRKDKVRSEGSRAQSGAQAPVAPEERPGLGPPGLQMVPQPMNLSSHGMSAAGRQT